MKPDSWAAGAKASATALHNRTTQIREPGVYIGFLEWIIWGLANKMTVLMLFGDAIQDIIGMFAPLAVPDDLRVGWAQALVAVVRCTPGGEVQAASGLHPLVNHFMIGSTVRLRPLKEPHLPRLLLRRLVPNRRHVGLGEGCWTLLPRVIVASTQWHTS